MCHVPWVMGPGAVLPPRARRNPPSPEWRCTHCCLIMPPLMSRTLPARCTPPVCCFSSFIEENVSQIHAVPSALLACYLSWQMTILCAPNKHAHAHATSARLAMRAGKSRASRLNTRGTSGCIICSRNESKLSTACTILVEYDGDLVEVHRAEAKLKQQRRHRN